MQQIQTQFQPISTKDEEPTSIELVHQSPDEREILFKLPQMSNRSGLGLIKKRKSEELDQDQIFQKVLSSSFKKNQIRKKRKSQFCVCILIIILIVSFSFFFFKNNNNPTTIPIQSKDRLIKKDSHSTNNTFAIQKNFYIYGHHSSTETFLASLQFKNNLFFANKSGFTYNIIDTNNYQKHVSKETGNKIKNLVQRLKQQINILHQTDSPRNHFDSILQKIIMLCILKDNGGIIVTESLTITEDFSWIENIKDNIYVNRGHNETEPQVVGFYSPYYSSQKQHQLRRRQPPLYEVQNQVILHPTIQRYFVAAKKNSSYIVAVVEQIFKILYQPSIVASYFQEDQYIMRGVSGKDIYYQYDLIACQKVIQQKQKELDMQQDNIPYRKLAIDYYGLFLINCYYGPFKLLLFWDKSQPNKIFHNLARYDMKQLEANIGPMRYLTFLNPEAKINYQFIKVKKLAAKPILKGSFVQQIFFPNQQEYFIQQNKEKQIINKSSERWNNLPKIIWIYWDKSIKNSGASNQLCAQNLKRFGAESGFKLKEVNDQNLQQYLDKQTLAKIQFSLNNAKVQTYPQTKSDLYRLALITKYGGIYMDASYIAVQNFEWLLNIGSYPSQYIFNRYGHLPRVLMAFHPHYGSPFNWEVNQKYNTKIQWHLAYQNNLIIAEEGSELIKQWFQLYLKLLLTPYKQIEIQFQQCLISKDKWTSQNSQYLLAMDSIKCVIGRRQVWLQNQTHQWHDASDYYKIWSISGYLGQQKFRSNTNFQNPHKQDHLFLYHYSQHYVEGLLGKVRHFTKFYSHHSKQVSKFIKHGVQRNFTIIAHPESIFMKYMYNQKFQFDIIEDQAKLRYSE